MKYSIFHTSHCGSTLLATKLSKSLPTLTEPDWSHELKNDLIDNIKKTINIRVPEEVIVKYSSHFPYLASFITGKKVFLYRKLNHHLQKFNVSEKIDKNLNYAFQTQCKALHKELRFCIENGILNLENSQEALVIFWINRLLWMKDNKDILFIEANNFFKNQEQVCKEICDWFDIDYKPININFHVKKEGLNHQSNFIDWTQLNSINSEFNSFIGVFENSTNKTILELCNKVKNYFPKLKDYL